MSRVVERKTKSYRSVVQIGEGLAAIFPTILRYRSVCALSLCLIYKLCDRPILCSRPLVLLTVLRSHGVGSHVYKKASSSPLVGLYRTEARGGAIPRALPSPRGIYTHSLQQSGWAAMACPVREPPS